MKKKYDLIVLLQSYPNLIHAINYIFDNKEKKILILINGDLNIYKFLIKLFDQANIEVKIGWSDTIKAIRLAEIPLDKE